MALGKRKTEQQQELFVPADQLPRSPGHVFYRKLNDLLAEAAFDAWLEELCPFLCRWNRTGKHSARNLLPHAAGRLLRGHWLSTRDRLAL